MERLKSAIAVARESARQDLEQRENAARNASPNFDATMEPDFRPPQRNTRSLAIPLLLALVAAIVFWVLRPASGVASKDATEQTNVPSEPATATRAANANPAQTLEPAPLGSGEAAAPASAEVPAVAAEATSAEKPSGQTLNAQVEAAVEAWRQAWAARDMMTYLNAYSDTFTPANGESLEDWIAGRYRNVGGRVSIDVQIKNLQVVPTGDGRARVSFIQDYASGSYREKGQPKTLDMVRDTSGRWRINGEWQGKPPPLPSTGKS